MLRIALIMLVVLGSAVGQSAVAQYDRDGRYVPSPNGVPLDPSARPIPLYGGRPGEAIGEAILPRSAIQPLSRIEPLDPGLRDLPQVPSPRRVCPTGIAIKAKADKVCVPHRAAVLPAADRARRRASR